MEQEKVIQIKDLKVYYKDHKKNPLSRDHRRQVLKGVSLDIYEGEILGIAGESGCGKSTLAKALVGMNKDIEGELIQKYNDAQMVFQDPYSSLNPTKKIGWLLEEPLRADKSRNWTKEKRQKRAKEIMRAIGLQENMMDRYPSQLSGGQRQRVSIGVALMKSPKVLIADEPVSALDVTIQAQILELLQKLHQDMGITILFISHDLRVIYQICDHVAVMHEGIIEEYGVPRAVYKDPKSPYTMQLLEAAGIRQPKV
ncbi:ABC transporter ATP-binding protein [Butyrivibrio sp. AD3002]|uniref:ABC transporter ATP-binding protein n=1 Tax=Butyrivibrio sp. AD3002 TaxID=1280670 RepID=UPI0003F89C96|nr:dipeptide/oligopeptide/nickel ABC transporter ATP-binding protein [Butyrivibrio sp. AD3002]